MKLSNKQKLDLESIIYFIPSYYKEIPITDLDIEKFFGNSDKGLYKKEIQTDYTKIQDGYNVLLQGKKWRGIHIGMYEEGIMDGSVPYWELLKGMPLYIKDFIKKEMFQGTEIDKIDEVYKLTNETI